MLSNELVIRLIDSSQAILVSRNGHRGNVFTKIKLTIGQTAQNKSNSEDGAKTAVGRFGDYKKRY